MLTTIATGVLGMVLLAVCWLSVQQAWSRVFPDACADPDPLAERVGCHGCESEENCERRSAQRPETVRREIP